MVHCCEVAIFRCVTRMHKMSFEVGSQRRATSAGVSMPWRFLFLVVLAICIAWALMPQS